MKFFLAALLLFLGSRISSAQELFPLQQISAGAGNGCQKADLASGIVPAGWTCDSAYSDDFNGSGLPDSRKWVILQLDQPSSWNGTGCTSAFDSTTNFINQSGGVLHLITSGGPTAWTQANAVGSLGTRNNTGGYPFTDFYREVRFFMHYTGTINPNTTLHDIPDYGYVVPSGYGYAWDMIEFEFPEQWTIHWLFWGMTPPAPNLGEPPGTELAASDALVPPWNFSPSTLATGPTSGYGGWEAWNTMGMLKQGSTFTLYWNGVSQGAVPGLPAEMANYHSAILVQNGIFGGTCPTGVGSTDMQIDHIHVFHR